uniref:Uncharacterized protein n=1 Tax=viral metagenome TaxID=1070528 RepID=A0A6C0DQB6_9ZZZZ
MDLTQSKLLREEWESIETPVSIQEKQILKLMMDGFNNVSISTNYTQSMFSVIKVEKTPDIEFYLYQKYFAEPITSHISKSPIQLNYSLRDEGGALRRLKSADAIRLQNMDNNVQRNKETIFEFVLIELCGNLIKNINKNKEKTGYYVYTLSQLKKTSITNINIYVTQFVDYLIEISGKKIDACAIVSHAYEIIEKNPYVFKYEDIKLYPHQKQLYSIFNKTDAESIQQPKLVLYTAPTGTGKTISPIGLLDGYRVIFVCVARHIGLALAKAAISMEKKVAFAFGCETASDIRLHYFAAVNFTKNKRSGGIGKVDNSEGSKVELMICDVHSYITAMHYMLAFNSDRNKIITYWDEPTIAMDYETHFLHETIHRNWSKNLIPNMVLSCATLPKEEEIQSVIDDFREKFDNATVQTITSFDCKKSIPILNKDGFCVLPHMLYPDFQDLQQCVEYCNNNRTLLRYFDLREILRFITYINEHNTVAQDYLVENYFHGESIANITMDSIKIYYLMLLKNISKMRWDIIHNYMVGSQKRKFQPNIKKMQSLDSSITKTSATQDGGNKLTRTNSVSITTSLKASNVPTATAVNNAASANPATTGILITTIDAYTLTDGPTIFLTEDVKKIGLFYVQQSNISTTVFQHILHKITRNNDVVKRIEILESQLAEKQEKTFDDTSKAHKSSSLISNSKADRGTGLSGGGESTRLTKESEKLLGEINQLRSEIMNVSLDPMYIPNSKPHQEIWAPGGAIHKDAFVASIDEETAKQIMTIDIENNLKVLLMLGIGMFLEKANIAYMELMKKLATEQRLFIIIASSDYIYGTNYNFTHGFIGKDLVNMTQNKIMQCLGRIGRNRIQQEYTARFRDDNMIRVLFQNTHPENNREAVNMCALFSTDAEDRA